MDLYIILLNTILCFMIGVYFGYNYCQNKMMNELTEMITDQIEYLNHEIVDGQHYLYHSENNSFVGQGNTLEQAAENYSLNSNGHIGHVKKSPLNISFFIVDGKIEKVEA